LQHAQAVHAIDLYVWVYRGVAISTSGLLLFTIFFSFSTGADIDGFLLRNKSMLAIICLMAALNALVA
jgi:hypothetical protein